LGNDSFLQTKSIEEENVEEKKPGEEIRNFVLSNDALQINIALATSPYSSQ